MSTVFDRRHLVIAALLIAMMGCGDEPQINLKPSLAGTVTNAVTKVGIPGVVVRCQGVTATTDANGAYGLDLETAGTYRVTATHPNYVEGARDILVGGIATKGDFQLDPKS